MAATASSTISPVCDGKFLISPGRDDECPPSRLAATMASSPSRLLCDDESSVPSRLASTMRDTVSSGCHDERPRYGCNDEFHRLGSAGLRRRVPCIVWLRRVVHRLVFDDGEALRTVSLLRRVLPSSRLDAKRRSTVSSGCDGEVHRLAATTRATVLSSGFDDEEVHRLVSSVTRSPSSRLCHVRLVRRPLGSDERGPPSVAGRDGDEVHRLVCDGECPPSGLAATTSSPSSRLVCDEVHRPRLAAPPSVHRPRVCDGEIHCLVGLRRRVFTVSSSFDECPPSRLGCDGERLVWPAKASSTVSSGCDDEFHRPLDLAEHPTSRSSATTSSTVLSMAARTARFIVSSRLAATTSSTVLSAATASSPSHRLASTTSSPVSSNLRRRVLGSAFDDECPPSRLIGCDDEGHLLGLRVHRLVRVRRRGPPSRLAATASSTVSSHLAETSVRRLDWLRR
ncbi:uncharacterized protein SCHCODRAFT_02531458 [Schizophyllum commune H4-8]|nr:uncharacterized protein SCHCODRAFT_02531458 [Schizophyllum commune H4-8]KAI5895989.1 hypothetical protein SCHCODRAFT_02531458 [Schizophyllum commune H4-8]